MAIEYATLGGGCFWCLDSVFRRVVGVKSVISGYAGGETPEPSYRQVCSGGTGHAEVVQIAFDNSQVSFEQLLALFFVIHDPTTLNRQGADVGSQYRSIVLCQDEAQKAKTAQVIAQTQQAGIWDDEIVTQVAELSVFYPAEDEHQDYFTNNPNNRYCQVVIAPKLAKFIAHYPELLVN